MRICPKFQTEKGICNSRQRKIYGTRDYRQIDRQFPLRGTGAALALRQGNHLGFEVFYVYRGVVRKCRPDFLIRLASGDMLVLEVKGKDSEQHRTKRDFLDRWVAAVNEHGGFGRWAWAVSRNPGDIHDILTKNMYAERV